MGRRKDVHVVAALIWHKDTFLICQRPADKVRGLLWEFILPVYVKAFPSVGTSQNPYFRRRNKTSNAPQTTHKSTNKQPSDNTICRTF